MKGSRTLDGALGSSRDSAGLDASNSASWELAASATMLERSLLARRLHDGPLQDIAAGMLHLQIEADRTDPSSRPALERAIVVLIDQQRTIRQMVEGMLEGDLDIPIAMVLEALAMRRRALGQKLTWKVVPPGATLSASSDLRFRLRLLEGLISLGSEADSASVFVDVSASGDLQVVLEGGARLVTYSIESAELRA